MHATAQVQSGFTTHPSVSLHSMTPHLRPGPRLSHAAWCAEADEASVVLDKAAQRASLRHCSASEVVMNPVFFKKHWSLQTASAPALDSDGIKELDSSLGRKFEIYAIHADTQPPQLGNSVVKAKICALQAEARANVPRPKRRAIIGTAVSTPKGSMNETTKQFAERSRWQKIQLAVKISALDFKASPLRSGITHMPTVVAADAFDQRHERRTAKAERVFHVLREDAVAPGSVVHRYFTHLSHDVARNRYIAPERMEPKKASLPTTKRPPRPKTAPKPKTICNIWEPRASWCDAKSLYDTDAIIYRRFQIDWRRALTMGVVKTIKRWDDDAELDDDGDGIPDEVVEVGETLLKHARLVDNIFSYYAASNSQLNFLELNAFTSFVNESAFVEKRSKFCKTSDFDLLFCSVDAAGKKSVAEQGGVVQPKSGQARLVDEDRKNALGRAEFMVALVGIAIARLVKPGHVKDVSEALDRILRLDVVAHAPEGALADRDRFRDAHLYTTETNALLIEHESSLRAVFSCIAGSSISSSTGTKGQSIGLDEWVRFLMAAGLVGLDLSLDDAVLCFSFSRMCVVDSQTVKGFVKSNRLPFEGFLEALGRSAALKAWPTAEEVAAAQCEDAWHFMSALRAGNIELSVTHDEFVKARAAPWGMVSTAVPFVDCLRNLLFTIFQCIEDEAGKSNNLQISEEEAMNWMKLIDPTLRRR